MPDLVLVQTVAALVCDKHIHSKAVVARITSHHPLCSPLVIHFDITLHLMVLTIPCCWLL
jgi:hypothetical protein